MWGRSLTRKPEPGIDVTAIGMSARLPAPRGWGWGSAPWLQSYGGLITGCRAHVAIHKSPRNAVLLSGGRISYMIGRTQ